MEDSSYSICTRYRRQDGTLEVTLLNRETVFLRSKKAAKQWLKENQHYILGLDRNNSLCPNGLYNHLWDEITFGKFPEE